MTNKAGIWIDHRKAVVVRLTTDTEDVLTVSSDVDRRPRPRGGAPSTTPYGPKDAVADNKLERKYKHLMSRYYDDVLSSLNDTNAILIIGPGEAKIALKKHIESKTPHIKIEGVEPAEKLTEHQIKSKTRRFFQG